MVARRSLTRRSLLPALLFVAGLLFRSSAFVVPNGPPKQHTIVDRLIEQVRGHRDECEISQAGAVVEEARARFPDNVDLKILSLRIRKLQETVSDEEEERELTSILELLPLPPLLESTLGHDSQSSGLLGPEGASRLQKRVEVLLLLHRYDEAFRLQRALFLEVRSVPPAHSGRRPLVKSGDLVGIGKLQHDIEQLTRLAGEGLLNQAVLESVVPLFQRVIRLLEPRAASEKRIGCTLLSVMPIKEGFRLLACPRVRASDALRVRRAQACRP